MGQTNDTSAFAGKICSRERLLELRADAAARGQRLVHCHGCFDIVHPGHVRHLQHARQLGEKLVVTLTADVFVNKGDARPLFDQDLRAENLAALACVDYVYVNDAPTATELLSELRPDIYIKGAEYETNRDPRFIAEREAVEQNGGRVVFTSGDVVFSSTALIGVMGSQTMEGLGHTEDPESVSLRRLRETHGLDSSRVGAILSAMAGKRLVIVGETIIDSYVECAWPEVTTEAPMMTLRPRARSSFDGGAAILAQHAAALGARPTLVTPLPTSIASEALCERLGSVGIEVVRIPMDCDIPEKERMLVGRDKLVKIDRSTPIELDTRTRTRLVSIVKEISSSADAAIVTDFGLGMLNPTTTREVFGALRPNVGTLTGDVSGSRGSLLAMQEADWLTPSERELRGALGEPLSSLPAVVVDLLERTQARFASVTMAADGVVTFSRRAAIDIQTDNASRLDSEHIPALNKAPVDTLGCGDAMLTLGTLALACGENPAVATYVGSIAAASTAGRMGNPAVEPREITAISQRVDLAQPGIRRTERAELISQTKNLAG